MPLTLLWMLMKRLRGALDASEEVLEASEQALQASQEALEASEEAAEASEGGPLTRQRRVLRGSPGV